MLPYDDVTFKEQVKPFCINCGAGDITTEGEPFYGAKLHLVVPLKCERCKHSFSIIFDISPEGMCSR